MGATIKLLSLFNYEERVKKFLFYFIKMILWKLQKGKFQNY